jgi:tRNA-binding protein
MADFTPAPIKPVVGITALEALDIRVGTIERVEEVPRSDKLMKLTVNFGDHTRAISRRDQEGARKSG